MDAAEARQHLAEERERLLALRASFAAEHLDDEREDASIGELSGHDQHQADVGTETFEREKDLSILEQIEAELADVEHALERLDAGTYGLCEACGGPIGDERLRAMPAARFCVTDQAAAERDMSARRAARE
jgi:RNA polymerase-binding transcription factor DksA